MVGCCVLSAVPEVIKIERDQLYHLEKRFQLSDLRDLLFSENRQVGSPYQNDFYQLVLYTKGRGRHKIDFNTYSYRAPALIPIAKGQVQSFENSSETDAFILSFSEQFLYRYEDEMQWLHQLRLFDPQRQNQPISLDDADFNNLSALIRQMKTELANSHTDSKQTIIHDLLRVFINCSERLIRDAHDSNPDVDSDYDLFCRFRQLLDSDYQSCHLVKDYADKIGMTCKKLNGLTQRYAGKHAKRMVEERVLLEIKRQLLFSNTTVKTIAMETGFKEPSNFVKFFKRNTSFTPAEFRISMKKGAF